MSFLGCRGNENQSSRPILEPHYVGRARCISCHADEYKLFSGSDHDLSMAPATKETVLGDFEDATFTHFGITSRFFRRDGKFFAFTQGPDGKLDDYEIKYTFGVRPLQQYLVGFPGGRLQCLPLAWDTRPKEDGGQRWFYLYPEEPISPNDILYWTRVSQNWNYMCAECHSTHLQKNYDELTNTYNTTWSEIDVSCEACHGPGSRHVEWAEASPKHDAGNAALTTANGPETQVDMCGRCHAHRSIISENYVHGQPLSNTYQVSLLGENLYFPDGQIKEEVYVYGSFLQSKMYRAGVVCTDCHDPHSTKLVLAGDGLCLRCHLPQKYGTTDHHFHEVSSAVKCVDCHMPERTYMVVDDRRDHSFRVPRPDVSVKLKTPNACNQCHADKTIEWAARHFKEWYPERWNQKHFGEIFYAAQKSDPKSAPELLNLIADVDMPAIIRATAVSLQKHYLSITSPEVFSNIIADSDPLLRIAAVGALQGMNPKERRPFLRYLLHDSVPLVRSTAARLLATDTLANLTSMETTAFASGLDEYKNMQNLNADYPAARLNLANLYLERAEYRQAEFELAGALAMEPLFLPSYINLADLYRIQNQDFKGQRVLLQGLRLAPDDASLHHALGLFYIRTAQNNKALHHFAVAARNAPKNARYSYVYAVALHSAGKESQAITILEKTLTIHPYDRDVLQALVSFYQKAGNLERAKYYAGKLKTLYDIYRKFD